MTTVKDYLIARLIELGGRHLFGVPGNYNAEFLLAAQRSGKLEWVGTTNELEAGYAADAYARVTRRIGICCVTYGVGSFSLLTAFAGSHVEFCPVVLINGSAPAAKARQLVEQGVLFAHAIDPTRTDEGVFRQITDPRRRPGDPPLTAVITDSFDAPEQIDTVLRGCLTTGRPIYLEVLQNVWGQPCADPLGTLEPLPEPVPTEEQETTTRAAVQAVLKRLQSAKYPVLWGGELLQRLGLERHFQQLIDALAIPYTTTLMAKGLVSETENARRFIGVYDSIFAPADVKQVVEAADCLIGLGTILSDFYGYIADRARTHLVVAARRSVRVADATYLNVPLDTFVRLLVDALPSHERGPAASVRGYLAPEGFQELVAGREARNAQDRAAYVGARDYPVTWDSFFQRMRTWAGSAGESIEDRVLLVDTSLALFPSAEIPIRQAGRWVAQTAWLSIGYTVGAAVGVSAAVPRARPVAFVGDGGFQTIPQAFSTLARRKIPAVLFVLDNGLYAIEQYLVDQQVLPPNEQYFRNAGVPASHFDILPRWDYVKLAEAFGGTGFAVRTHAELEAALDAVATLRDRPAMVAVALDPKDLPAELRATIPPPASLAALDAEHVSSFRTESTVIARVAFN